MPTLITKTCGTGKEFPTFAEIRTYVIGLDLLALDQTIELRCSGTIVCPNNQTTGPLTSDDTHRVVFLPAVGEGVNDLNRSIFDQGSSGAALSFNRNGETKLSSGVDIVDMRWLVTGGTTSGSSATGCGGRNSSSTYDNIILRNRIYDTSLAEGDLLSCGNQNNRTRYSDNLIILTGGINKTVFFESATTIIERNTIIALGDAIGDAKGHRGTNNSIVRNNLFLGFSYLSLVAATAGVGNFSSRTPTAGKTSGVTISTVANSLVVNDASDFRPKSGGPMIDAADDTANVAPDILGNNRGAAPDSSAWQLSPFSPLPKGKITTSSSVNGTVTISGTTENTPASGMASLTPTSRPYNSGVTKGPVSIQLGTNTFSVSFPNTLAGEYLPSVTFTNDGGSQAAFNESGNVLVVAANGVLTSQTLNGQVISFTGTVSGSPLSGSVQVDVSSSSTLGGTAAGPVALTITGSNFTGSISLMPGEYSAPVIRFTNAGGTSLPIAGTSPVSILGFDGNPEAPDQGDAPVITAVTVSPMTATGSTTFTATVTGPSSPPQNVIWTATGGTINSSGVFAAPAATSSTQTITVTATSSVDSSKSGTATVTIAASAASTVTGISVSPGTATGSTTFLATVSGTNSPSQAVTWAASAGSINATSGVFTAPAATSTAQNITITARSVQDPTKTGTASVAIAATTPSPQRSVSLTMLNAASLTGLKWSWFDQAMPSNFAAPTDKGSIESTNANGLIVIPLPNSQLSVGGIGWLIITNSDGNPATAHSAFCGPRAVS